MRPRHWSTVDKVVIVAAIVLIAVAVAMVVGTNHAGRAAIIGGGALVAIVGRMIRGRATSSASGPPNN